MLKRHILKKNKHSSVPFWWPRRSWVYSAGSQQARPSSGFLPPSHPERAHFSSGHYCWQDRRQDNQRGSLEGWRSAFPVTAQQRNTRLSFELGHQCSLTPCTSRSGSARRASTDDMQEMHGSGSFSTAVLQSWKQRPQGRVRGVTICCVFQTVPPLPFTTTHPRSWDVKALNGGLMCPGAWLGLCGFRVTFPL